MADKPYYQVMNSSEGSRIMQEIRRCGAEGTLPAAASRLMSATKPREELYDIIADPHELVNLAESPGFSTRLERMRAAHLRWQDETRDLAWIPEPELYRREKERGTRLGLLGGQRGAKLLARLRQAHQAGETHDVKALKKAATDEDPAVRYWAVQHLRAPEQIKAALSDPNPTVRIAAARAGLRGGLQEPSAALLAREMNGDDEWLRLLAAIVLDEVPEAGRPHIEVLRRAKTDSRNTATYVPRVVNHTLNVLLNTTETVR
jgi:HEAT repeat protein